jgi:hypothetical protein
MRQIALLIWEELLKGQTANHRTRHNLNEEKTSKFKQWKALEESINRIISPEEQQDYIV